MTTRPPSHENLREPFGRDHLSERFVGGSGKSIFVGGGRGAACRATRLCTRRGEVRLSGHRTCHPAEPAAARASLAYPASEIYFFKPLNERVPVFQKPFRLVQEVVLDGTPAAQEALRGKQEIHPHGHAPIPGVRRKGLLQPGRSAFVVEAKPAPGDSRTSAGEPLVRNSRRHCQYSQCRVATT